MADQIDPKQQHLDDHYGDLGLTLVPEPTDDGKGMSAGQAKAFLRGLRPVARARQRLGDAVKKTKPAA